MSKPDILTLAAISGSSGAYGTIPTIPAAAVLYVRCPCGDAVEKLLWSIQCNKAHAYQLYLAERILVGELATLTLASLANAETIFIMGNVYTGATSTTTWSARTISIAGDNTADALLLAKAITGGRLVTLASVEAGDWVKITDSAGVVRTVTAHADTTTAANREFKIDPATDALDAAEFITACSTTGAIAGVTLTQGAATGEILINWTTPTGGTPPVVTSSNGTRLAVTTIGETYIYATAALAVVTLKYRPAYVDVVEGNVPFVFQATTGTAAGHCAVSHTLLSSLYKDGAAVSSIADNSTTAGSVYSQTINGWAQAYIAVTNSDGANPATMVIKANRLRYRS